MTDPAERPQQFTLQQLMLMRPLIRDDIDAYKNHIVTRVEHSDYLGAKNLVETLREKQEIFKSLNRAIHAITGQYT